MSKTKLFLITFLTLGLLGLGGIFIALAQESPATGTPEGDEITSPVEEAGLPPKEVMQDMEVSADDLGAKPSIIKPDSIFHPLKHLGRNFMEVITFEPIKDTELKLKHANQELSEIKQLIDEKGINNINPDDLVNSVNWFGNKIKKIKNASKNLKDKKNDQPEKVEALLNNFTDKQFKQQKILETFNEEITEYKEEIEEAEDVFAAIKDKQSEVLKYFGEVLAVVDDPERVPERLVSVADEQKGSNFKLIKTAEILEKLEEQLPEKAKETIERAQKKTFEKLQEDVAELPAIVRAEKFEQYTNALPGDETIQLGIFEKIKQLPNIPQDMLEKIEEVKEFAVKRFEDKISKFDKPEVQDKFFENLQGNDLDDIMALEELKAKISAKQEEIRQKIEEKHIQGVETFKKRFTDVKSQEQASSFERLVKEMTTNPSPTTLRLIQALETEVAQDAEKRAFIEDIKNKTKAEFENKFRLEGERFFDRISSFNPEDMAVFQEFEKERFFDPRMMEKFYDHQTDRFKEHIQGIENPEMFNRFDERIRLAPTEVVNMIQTRDREFGEVLQFKARKMMEMELNLKEHETRLAIERAWRDSEDDFHLQMRQVKSDQEKAQLYEQKRERDFSLMEKEFEERRKIMEARFANDPFCDAMCQEFQRMHMEQEMFNKQWNLQEDARMREFELEMEMRDRMEQDPFAGRCFDPKSCMKYCNQNPNFAPCQIHGVIPPPVSGILPTGKPFPGQGPSCPPGEINMPVGPNEWKCVFDPYYRPPEVFKQCPPGHFWNEEKSFCQFDESKFMPPADMRCGDGRCDPTEYCPEDCKAQLYPGTPMPPIPSVNFCGPGEYWDNMRGCMRDDFNKCPAGHFFDFFEDRCVPEWKSCPPGEYWDPGRQSCIRDVVGGPVEECPPGHFFDFYKRQCIREIICPTIMPRPCEPGEMPTRDECGPSCIPTPTKCSPGERWDGMQGRCIGICPTFWDPVCGLDGVTYSNECFAKQAGVGVKRWGECEKKCGSNICSGGLDCVDYGRGICCQGGQLACPDGRCAWSIEECGPTECNYNGVCDYNETNESCPKDCGVLKCFSCYCGNNICEIDESISSCPGDCGGEYGGTCGYVFDPSGSNLDIPAGSSNGLEFSIKQIDSNCTNDKVTLELIMGDGSAAPSWCTLNAPAISFSGMSANTVYVSCAPSAANIGDYSIWLRTDSAANRAQGMTHPYSSTNFTVNVREVATTCAGNSYTTSVGVCNYTSCPSGCVFDNGCPVGCITDTGVCGDGVCNNNETQTSCPGDCGGTALPVSGEVCANSGGHACAADGDTQLYCSPSTMRWQFSQYCSTSDRTCANGYCKVICGDGICGTYESADDCPNYTDCGTAATTTPDVYCGDGTCSDGETADSCSVDCQGNYCGGIYCPLGKVCADAASRTCCNPGEYFCNNGCSATDCALPQCEEGPIPSSGCICQGINKFEGNCCHSNLTDALVWTTVPCTQTCTSMGGVCCYGAASDCDNWSNQWATDCQGYVCCVGRCATATYCGDGVCDSDEDSSLCPDDCVPEEYVNLHSIAINGSILEVNYSKNFATCAHLLDSSNNILHSNNVFCDQADNVWSYSNLSIFSVVSGQQVKLCHGNNYNICSDYATVTGSAKSITVTSPSAGEQWVKGNTYNISWQYGGWEDSQYVHIDVITGSGGFTLFSQNDNILVSSGNVSWTIGDKWPDLPTGDSFYIRVFVVPIGWEQGVDYDKSDYFSIVEPAGGGANIFINIGRFFQQLFGF